MPPVLAFISMLNKSSNTEALEDLCIPHDYRRSTLFEIILTRLHQNPNLNTDSLDFPPNQTRTVYQK